MDLNLLVIFEALMEERSVIRTAGRVGLSQPATSNALSRLRRTFDDPLFLRSPKGMIPTPLAETLIGPVREALGHLRQALEPQAFSSKRLERTFRVLANDYVEEVLLPQLLALTVEASPGVRFKVRRQGRLFGAPDPRLLADSHDLAVGFFPDSPALDSNLRSRVLRPESNAVIVSRNHRAIGEALTLESFAAARHAVVFYRSWDSGLVDALLAEKGVSRKIAAYLPHFRTAAQVVAATDLIAIIPERLARSAARSLPLRVHPVPFEFPEFRLTMVWHQRRHNDRAHRWLRERIVEAERTSD